MQIPNQCAVLFTDTNKDGRFPPTCGGAVGRMDGQIHLTVGIGKDHTLFATADGVVQFKHSFKDRVYVSVVDAE